MAKIKFGSIITDARGKIAGHVLRMTRFGSILSNLGRHTTTPTALQSQQRGLVGEIAQLWNSGLTQSERNDWNDLAETLNVTDPWGTTYPLTGIGLFLRLNVKRSIAQLSYFTTAPANQDVTAPLTAILTISAGPTLEVYFTTTPVPTNHRVRVSVSSPRSPGTANVAGYYVSLTTSAAGQTSPWDITSLYQDRFGPIPTDKKIYGKVSFWNSTNGAESAAIDSSIMT